MGLQAHPIGGSVQATTYVIRTSEAAQPAHGFRFERLFLLRVDLRVCLAIE